MSETNSWSDEIACPHCGHKIRDLWEYEIAVYDDADKDFYGKVESEIQGHIFTLRWSIARNRFYGEVRLSDQDEAALRASTRKLPTPKVVDGILEDPSTITPAPAPMKQLGARRARGVKPKAPEGPSRVVAVGGVQLLMLGPGDLGKRRL